MMVHIVSAKADEERVHIMAGLQDGYNETYTLKVNTVMENQQRLSEEEIKLLSIAIEDIPKDAKAYIFKGIALAHIGKHRNAVNEFNKAINLGHNYTDIYYLKGTSLTILEQYEEAIISFNKSINLDTNNTKVYFSRGITFYIQKRYKEAVKDFNEAIKADPNKAETYSFRGMVLNNLGQYEEAVLDFTKTIEMAYTNTDIYYNRGAALTNLKQYEKAIPDYKKAIDLDSSNIKAYFSRGTTFSALKRYEEAIIDFQKVIDLDPNNARAHFYKGTALAILKKYKDAILEYNKAIDIDPQNAEIYNNKGLALTQLGEYNAAVLEYNKAIDINSNAEIYNNKGLALTQLGDYKAAIDNYIIAIKLDPSNGRSYFLKGKASANLQQYNEAIEDYDIAIKVGFRDNNTYYNKGKALANLEQYEEAIISYNEAIKIDCYDADIYYEKGLALIYLKQYKDAIWNFQKAHNLTPDDIGTLYMLGYAYISQKKWKRAATVFNEAKEDVLDVLTIFNETEQIENVISYMIDINRQDFFNKTINTNDNTREYYKSIYITILQIIQLLHVKNENESSLAHYTKRSTTALLLFEGSKFRLNSTITANDPQEGKTLIKYLFNKDNLNREKAEKENKNHDYKAFIGCFTFNLASLNQFRLYGKEADKEATGVSLVLNKNFFNERMDIGLLSSCEKGNVTIKKDDLPKYALFRCIYIDPTTHKIASLGHREGHSFYTAKEDISEEVINKYIEEINNTQKKVEDLLNILSVKVNNDNLDKGIICELLLPLRYLVKHVAFKEEQECRIFDIKDLYEEKLKQAEDREVKFTPDYSQMYIEYQPITEEHLQEIIFAPKAKGIDIFKKAAEQKSLTIECKMSTHPFT